MKQKVLILSYYFPPMGMGGTQRIAKFCKYLPEFGWQPLVVTVKSVQYYAQDSTLLQDLPGVKIYRTGSLDPLRLLAWWREHRQMRQKSSHPTPKAPWSGKSWLTLLNKIVSGWLLIPDSKILWLPFALIKAIQIIQKEKIQIILTTSPPHSSHLAGVILKWLLKIKWIADFRDEWTEGESQPCPTVVHKVINRSLERLVLKQADHVIGICQKLVDNLQRKANRTASAFSVIMNGYDAADFRLTTSTPPTKKLTFVHCGSISKVSNPEPFLAAMSTVFQERPELAPAIQIRFVGTDIFSQLLPLLEKYELRDNVEIVGYVPHQIAIQEMFMADVLLLFVIKTSGEEIITSKIFEYLATGRTILAIIPEGELAEIIRTAHAGYILSHADLMQLKQTILLLYEKYRKHQLNKQPHPYIKRFERRFLTENLAHLMVKEVR